MHNTYLVKIMHSLNQFLVLYSNIVIPLLYDHALANNTTTDLEFWVRDLKYETKSTKPTTTTTVDGKALLGQIIGQYGGNHSVLIDELKALRRSGVSLDGLISEIDEMEHDVKTMNYYNEVEKQLQRKRLEGTDLLQEYEEEKRNKINKNTAINRLGKNSQSMPQKTYSNKINSKRQNENLGKKNDVSRVTPVTLKKRTKQNQRFKILRNADESTIGSNSTSNSITKAKKAFTVANENVLRPRDLNNTKNKLKSESFKNHKILPLINKNREGDQSITPVYEYKTKEEKKKRQEIYEHGKELLRKGREQSKKWPKIKASPHKLMKSDQPERVTQMDPLLLRTQKENDLPESKEEQEDPKKPPLALNPYSIKKQMRDMCIKHCAFPGTNISIHLLGKTVEFNDLVMLKVTEKEENKKERYLRTRDEDKYIEEEPEKKIFFIVHGLSTMGINRIPCLSIIRKFKRLLSFYFKHLDKFDIFLVPMANPDGIAYVNAKSMTPLESILWNKNLSPQSACPGVCLDRNFDVAWNGSRTVSSCSQQYPGPMAFSEPETRAIRDVFHRYSHKIIAYLHVHAGSHSPDDGFKGDAVLYPKGYTEAQSDDDRYIDLRGDIDEAMKNASFKVYSVATETLANWYGTVSGSSVDFASSVYGIRYAMELVMQPLNDDLYIDDIDGREQNHALNEVWKRVIDAIFTNIYRSIKKDDHVESEKKRKK